MTRPAQWVAALALLAAAWSSALAAEPPAAHADLTDIAGHALGSIQDIPAGPAAIRGRVVHDERAANVAGMPVVLYAQPPGRPPGLRTVMTDEIGAFVFESVANDPATIYLLGTRYAEIPFGTRFSFDPGELERSVDLSIADPSSDTSGAAVGEVRIEVEKSCASLLILESYRLDNPGAQALFVPESERDGREPILRVTLPDDASSVETGAGAELAMDGHALSFWGPLRPGQQEVEIRYEIPERGPAFELRRDFPSGARSLLLVQQPGGPTLTRSDPGDAQLRPGDSVALRVELPAVTDTDDSLAALDVRVWLELDGAALTVEQQYTLAAKRETPVLAASGAPLLCFAIPDGADDLRFSSETLETHLFRDPSGALALRGPLPVGETKVALRYLLPIDRIDPLYSQVMPIDVPLLSILIADTGLAIETTRLHRKRPIRTPDRAYLHLEAFEIPAGEPVELRLQPLEARKTLPVTAATGIALATAALAIGFLIAPLRQVGAEPAVPPSAASRAAEQRESVLTAIRGLDEDYEIGKLSEEDYREMRQTLRAEAVNWLRVERSALAEVEEVAETDAAPRSCPSCKAEVGVNARFCSHCGTPLGEPGSGDEAPPV